MKLAPLALGALLSSGIAAADSTSGVDGALFRGSYDSNGVFALEGARLLPLHDLSLRVLAGYAKSPLDLAVPGIGAAAGDTGKDRILDYVATLDMAFGITVADRVAIGLDVAAYRTKVAAGYGRRGRYVTGGAVSPDRPSTGLLALRPLSNIDASASPNDAQAYLGDQVAGPLDARAGIKVALVRSRNLAITAIGSVFLPFGEDELLLGDRNLVFEPKVAIAWHKDRLSATRLVANVAARIRQRSILESYDVQDAAQTEADAKVFLDVGSEAVVGAGGVLELLPRLSIGAEVQAFLPLPTAIGWGNCRRHNGDPCSALAPADYFAGKKAGDLAVLATGGISVRVSADVTANLMAGFGPVGARGDDFRLMTGLVWAPQPLGQAAPGRNDRDGDGIPDGYDACPDDPEDKDGFEDEDGCPDLDNDRDGIPDRDDACPLEPEDKDGFEDGDGCPEPDNDKDGIPDNVDRCPDAPEDKDGFEDEDGCPDEDNDGDGIPDAVDKCPNDPETVNGFEDEDGCPDVRGTTGPEERNDRIDTKAVKVTFGAGNATLTAPARTLLNQVAAIIKARKLTIRVEVHVALGTKATAPAAVAAQQRKDKVLAQQRAKAVFDYLISQGVAVPQLQAVGIGSDRPLGSSKPDDLVNERVDFIKAQQAGGTP
ncbi:MAG: OmpA family protein [Deltaproteobacteria bacterium]|nr:OmpA family protein [Deltaproteobacteria bacterium]